MECSHCRRPIRGTPVSFHASSEPSKHYQTRLSRKRAVSLADNVRTVYSPRWFGFNVETRVVCDTAT